MATPARTTLSQPTRLALIAAASVGGLMAVSGLIAILNGTIMFLFGFATTVGGIIMIALASQAWHGKRAPWAFLLAMTGVVAFNAFFAAPKVVSLPKMKQVTPELELRLGREKAEAEIDGENMSTRLINLAVCLAFATPFVTTCVLLARSSREFERRA